MMLLSADYSQIELRLLAHFSKTLSSLTRFAAARIFTRAPRKRFSASRRLRRLRNTAALPRSSISASSTASPHSASRNNSASSRRKRRSSSPPISNAIAASEEWLDRQVADVREKGFTRTLFGRVRQIPEISSPQPNLRNFAERTAMNTPLQGTAADLIKLAMIEIDRHLIEKEFASRMILQVHDEFLFEGPESELPKLRTLVKNAMEHAHELRVPLVVEMEGRAELARHEVIAARN